MDILVPQKIFDLLMISTTFSIILMALIQKIKTLKWVKTNGQIMFINFILSFAGIFFGISFYHLSMIDGIWVSIFSFIGAPAIYQLLKKQNIINYTPKSLDDCKDCVTIPKENVIDRDKEVK